MGQSASAPTVTDRSAGNGLTDELAAVQAARERLGRNLDRLNAEAQAQIGQTVERILWKAAAAGAALVAGLAVRKVLAAGWQAARATDPPEDPGDPGTSWGDALGWTVATAVGMGVAKVVAAKGAAKGWQMATGHHPPT